MYTCATWWVGHREGARLRRIEQLATFLGTNGKQSRLA
jgi:hypothetical protein